MKFKNLHPADQICQTMKRIYDRKETTVSGGNLSIRDKEGHIWVSPSGGDKGDLKREDVLEILPDGTMIGTKTASLETPIHLEILKVRPDIKAVLHAHSPAAVAISIVHEIPEIMLHPHLAALARKVKVAVYGAPGSDTLAQNVAQVFAEGYDVVILENHGLFLGSETGMQEAFQIFDEIDFGIRTLMHTPVLCGHQPRTLDVNQYEEWEEHMRRSEKDEFKPSSTGNTESLQREMMAMLCKRAYAKEIFSATGGVISARVDSESFLITPEGLDHFYADADDMVLVKNGKYESGKIPNMYVNLHRLIYEKNPGIGGIVMACPPYAMCYAVSEIDYDITLIPESYNILMSTKKFPFGTTFKAPESLAEYLAVDCPVAIVENECYIIASPAVFKSFDRFEITEYSAKAVDMTKCAKKAIVNITPEQMKELSIRVKERQKKLAADEKARLESRVHKR